MRYLNGQILDAMKKDHPKIAQQFMKAKWPEFVELKKKHNKIWLKYKNV